MFRRGRTRARCRAWRSRMLTVVATRHESAQLQTRGLRPGRNPDRSPHCRSTMTDHTADLAREIGAAAALIGQRERDFRLHASASRREYGHRDVRLHRTGFPRWWRPESLEPNHRFRTPQAAPDPLPENDCQYAHGWLLWALLRSLTERV